MSRVAVPIPGVKGMATGATRGEAGPDGYVEVLLDSGTVRDVHESEIFDIEVLKPCGACGADLALGQTCGVWVLAEIACEYRTCATCKSTRAYMAADVVDGRHCQVWDDHGVMWESRSFVDLLETKMPLHEGDVIMRNGVTLARTFVTPDGSMGWHVMPPEREMLP